MIKKALFNSPVITFSIPVILISFLVFLAQSTTFNSYQQTLSNAIIIDLLLTVPFVYFLLIRKKNIPKTTVVPLFILGIVIASHIIPKENQSFLDIAKTWLIPLVEISVLSLVGFKVYKTIQLYKVKKGVNTDFFTVVKNVCNEIVPKKLAIPMATEIGIIYYGFIHWKKIKLKENEFTYHKNTGSQMLLVTVIFLIVIETVAFHALLNKWSSIAAWMLTGLSIYSSFQIFGFLRSLNKRPIIIERRMLKLRYGIMCETDIEIKNIDSIELTTQSFDQGKEIKYLSFLGESEGHNIVIHLKKENTLIGLYGMNKKFKSIALFVDEKAKFKLLLENKL